MYCPIFNCPVYYRGCVLIVIASSFLHIRSKQASALFYNNNSNSNGYFGTSYNNNNNAVGRQNYNDRAGSYNQVDRAALWQQQQQTFHQFQQQPLKWNKGQPLFGQVFVGQNQVT
jgi:hypothetical protein